MKKPDSLSIAKALDAVQDAFVAIHPPLVWSGAENSIESTKLNSFFSSFSREVATLPLLLDHKIAHELFFLDDAAVRHLMPLLTRLSVEELLRFGGSDGNVAAFLNGWLTFDLPESTERMRRLNSDQVIALRSFIELCSELEERPSIGWSELRAAWQNRLGV